MNIGARNIGACLENRFRDLFGYKPFPVVNGYLIKPGANLAEANLSRALIPLANLREANLRGANLRGANIQWGDLIGADLRGADLRGALLGGTWLGAAKLHGADLRGAWLRGAWLGDIRDALVSGATLAKFVNDGRGRQIQVAKREVVLRNFSDLPSQRAKQEGRFDQWIKRDRSGEGPAAITRPAVNP